MDTSGYGTLYVTDPTSGHCTTLVGNIEFTDLRLEIVIERLTGSDDCKDQVWNYPLSQCVVHWRPRSK